MDILTKICYAFIGTVGKLKLLLYLNHFQKYRRFHVEFWTKRCRVVDPDWIRIQRLVWIRIRIGNPDPGARKLRNSSGKNALFSYFLQKFYH
jgi:hypothetical protein